MNAAASTLESGTALADELDAICASTAFRHSPQQQRFLRHLIARHGEGDQAALREIALAIDLFRRSASEFDPKKDPIVRVEARRLRERLTRYYALEGERAVIEIVVPIGSYVPVVRPRAMPATLVAATPPSATLLEERAAYVMRLRTIEGYRKALELYSRTAREFPGLATPHLGIAWARICTAGYDGVPPEAGLQREPFLAAIEAAATHDPEHSDLFALRGSYAARYEHSLATAEAHYQDGLNRNPTIATRTSYAWLCVLIGRFDEARRLFEAAHAADPYGFWHRHNLGSLAYFQRDYVSAEKTLREAIEIEPDHAVVRLVLAKVLMQCGRGAEALVETAWCRRALPGMTGAELVHIMALAHAGERKAAVDAMRDFERNRGERYTSSTYRAMAHVALDEPDQAIECLSRGAEEQEYWMPNIGVEPAFDRIRSRADFVAIARGIGLAA